MTEQQPVAWKWEQYLFGGWQRRTTEEHPGESDLIRRVQPLYASPDHIGNSTTMVPALNVARIKATIWKHWRNQNGQTLEDRFTSAAEEIAAMGKTDG